MVVTFYVISKQCPSKITNSQRIAVNSEGDSVVLASILTLLKASLSISVYNATLVDTIVNFFSSVA